MSCSNTDICIVFARPRPMIIPNINNPSRVSNSGLENIHATRPTGGGGPLPSGAANPSIPSHAGGGGNTRPTFNTPGYSPPKNHSIHLT